ncbi:Asp-tRNA(Asn)/Glu-tRNA(Gln) amidotransferase subunit GatA [Candidatus Dependentiae bacterium]|nr:Asp-tRNA(Asn)/Glu-tRNA(Gln) amidotransferase subunit GatA [Candidatus Dependentiae bacterium]
MNPFSTIKDLKEQIKNKSISANEALSFFQKRTQQLNEKLNAFTHIFEPEKLSTDNSSHFSLAGIPGIIKANIAVKGKPHHAGSNMLRNHHAAYNATIIEHLQEHNAPFIGIGNMDEFAMGSTGEYSAFGAAKNPWDITRSPGGSSSGISAAVAAGMVPWGIGTETGGSVRQPAAFCNLVGLYPTYGLFSRYGLIAFGSSLDQAGPITRTVYDNALIASALSGHDPKDSTSLPEPKKDYTKKLDGKMPENLTIGVFKEALSGEGIDPQIFANFKENLAALEKLGCKIKTIEHKTLKHGVTLYFILSRAEAASNLSRFDATLYGTRAKEYENLQSMIIKSRTEGFGTEVKRRIMMGNYVLSSGHREFYDQANTIRQMIRNEFDVAFMDVDLIVSPTTTTLPFKFGEAEANPLAIYMSDYFSVPICIAGLPSISIPGGFSKEGLPIGFQFIGNRLCEELLYRVAHALEQETGHFQKTPEKQLAEL